MSAPRVVDRLGFVACAYGYRVAFSTLGALGPAWLAGRVASGYGGGDADLFAPGGLLLLETARISGRALGPVLGAASALLLVAILLAPFPYAGLALAFARRGRVRAGEVVDTALRRYLGLFALFAAALGAEALAAAAVGSGAAKLLDTSGAEGRAADAAWVGVAVVTWTAVAGVGVLRDLATAAAVTGDLSFRAAIRRGVTSLRPSLALGYVARAVAMLAIVVAASLVLPWGKTPTALSLLVHQAAIFGVVALQASWVRACVIAVRREPLEVEPIAVVTPPPAESAPLVAPSIDEASPAEAPAEVDPASTPEATG
ncbi:MAG TPA: hypothetical protein VGM56_01625 [Byssovorax sp.]